MEFKRKESPSKQKRDLYDRKFIEAVDFIYYVHKKLEIKEYTHDGSMSNLVYDNNRAFVKLVRQKQRRAPLKARKRLAEYLGIPLNYFDLEASSFNYKGFCSQEFIEERNRLNPPKEPIVVKPELLEEFKKLKHKNDLQEVAIVQLQDEVAQLKEELLSLKKLKAGGMAEKEEWLKDTKSYNFVKIKR